MKIKKNIYKKKIYKYFIFFIVFSSTQNQNTLQFKNSGDTKLTKRVSNIYRDLYEIFAIMA
jgi:hypothetical protein